VSERLKFVLRLEAGERMTDLCKEFGISRKTGYKMLERHERLGLVGLQDESRRPERIPHRMNGEIEDLLLEARQAHPTWGPRKLRAWVLSKQPGLRLPAPSTIGDLLKRKGLVQVRRRVRNTPLHVAPLRQAGAPNDLWCADFKGQFRLGNGKYCYPVTITDQCSRYLLACEAQESTEAEGAKEAFAWAFREFGLPLAMRTDNGTPFASNGIAGLSKLSVWWMRLGIMPERIEPAHPEQNGRHERMHLTLKIETTRPAASNMLLQQERFDRLREIFNHERPHEALDQRPPASCYTPSSRRYPDKLEEPEYPLHDFVRAVSVSGHLRMGGRKGLNIFIGTALSGERLGLREIDEERWLISFMTLDLGEVDLREKRFEAADLPTSQPGLQD
jgi:transposase InsO family protein